MSLSWRFALLITLLPCKGVASQAVEAAPNLEEQAELFGKEMEALEADKKFRMQETQLAELGMKETTDQAGESLQDQLELTAHQLLALDETRGWGDDQPTVSGTIVPGRRLQVVTTTATTTTRTTTMKCGIGRYRSNHGDCRHCPEVVTGNSSDSAVCQAGAVFSTNSQMSNACAALTESECIIQPACDWVTPRQTRVTSECQGHAQLDCSSLYTEADCLSRLGCTWTSETVELSPSQEAECTTTCVRGEESTPCSGYACNTLDCNEMCMGLLSPEQCTAQNVCRWTAKTCICPAHWRGDSCDTPCFSASIFDDPVCESSLLGAKAISEVCPHVLHEVIKPGELFCETGTPCDTMHGFHDDVTNLAAVSLADVIVTTFGFVSFIIYALLVRTKGDVHQLVDFWSPIVDNPLGLFVLGTWAVQCNIFLCAVYGMSGVNAECTEEEYSTVRLFFVFMFVFGIIHCSFAYYMQRRLVNDIINADDTTKVSYLVWEILKRDIPFVFYFFFFFGTFAYAFWGFSYVSSTNKCGEKVGAGSGGVVGLAIVYGMLAPCYGCCFICGKATNDTVSIAKGRAQDAKDKAQQRKEDNSGTPPMVISILFLNIGCMLVDVILQSVELHLGRTTSAWDIIAERDEMRSCMTRAGPVNIESVKGACEGIVWLGGVELGIAFPAVFLDIWELYDTLYEPQADDVKVLVRLLAAGGITFADCLLTYIDHFKFVEGDFIPAARSLLSPLTGESWCFAAQQPSVSCSSEEAISRAQFLGWPRILLLLHVLVLCRAARP